MTRIQALSLLCNLLQILGLALIVTDVWKALPALIGVCGFAAVVKAFLPAEIDKSWYKWTVQTAAVCGGGLILLACFTS